MEPPAFTTWPSRLTTLYLYPVRLAMATALKEKLLAARMAHIRTVLAPEKNQADIAELSKEITRGLRIVYVKTMEEVLKEALTVE